MYVISRIRRSTDVQSYILYTARKFESSWHQLRHRWHHRLLFITVTSQWGPWRLKSPACRWFAQPFVQAQIKENIKAPRPWLFRGIHRWLVPWPLRGIHRWLVNSPYKGPVTRKMFLFDEVIMLWRLWYHRWRQNWHHDTYKCSIYIHKQAYITRNSPMKFSIPTKTTVWCPSYVCLTFALVYPRTTS